MSDLYIKRREVFNAFLFIAEGTNIFTDNASSYELSTEHYNHIKFYSVNDWKKGIVERIEDIEKPTDAWSLGLFWIRIFEFATDGLHKFDFSKYIYHFKRCYKIKSDSDLELISQSPKNVLQHIPMMFDINNLSIEAQNYMKITLQ